MNAAPKTDFFVSYTQPDRAWAEWIAWVLEEECGASVIIDTWDFSAGGNFVVHMNEAAKNAARTVAVLSPNYLKSGFATAEWAAAFAEDPTGQQNKLLPVRVGKCDLRGLLGQVIYVDLVGSNRKDAAAALLSAARGERGKPASEPEFPGETRPAERVTARPEPDFPGGPRHILHPRNPHFTGRDKELDELRGALTSGRVTALSALSGLGGIGKTQLALEYTYRHLNDYAGVWWFRAETQESLDGDFQSLAVALGLAKPPADAGEVRNWVHTQLSAQNEPWLLVFDNAEGPGELRPYLFKENQLDGNANAVGPHHQIVTSRQTGGWGGIAEPLEVAPLSPEEAVTFLLGRTRQTSEDDALQLAEALGCLPLALEQAAAYIDVYALSISAYYERFADHRSALLAKRADGDAASYPDSVATTWSLAFEQVETVSPAGADLLKLLSFFAAEDVSAEWLKEGAQQLPEPLASTITDSLALDDATVVLRRHSLVSGLDGRWTVHRLVQAVMRDRLGDERAAWAKTAVEVVEAAWPFELEDPGSWAPSSALVAHAIAAAGFADRNDVGLDSASELLDSVGVYLNLCRAQFPEALRLGQQALAIDERVYGAQHPRVAVRANNIGSILKEQRDFERALVFARRALEIHEKASEPDQSEVAINLNNIGMILKDQNDLKGALKFLRRGLAAAEEAHGSDHPTVAACISNVGHTLHLVGELDEALRMTRRALEMDQAAYGPEHPTVAIRTNNIGQILKDQGDLDGALECLRRAVDIVERVYDPDHPVATKITGNLNRVLELKNQQS